MKYLLDLYLRDVGVVSSNLATPTIKPLIYMVFYKYPSPEKVKKSWLHIGYTLHISFYDRSLDYGNVGSNNLVEKIPLSKMGRRFYR